MTAFATSLLLIAQAASGFSLLHLLGYPRRGWENLGASVLAGMILSSLVVIFLDLLPLAITAQSFWTGQALLTLVLVGGRWKALQQEVPAWAGPGMLNLRPLELGLVALLVYLIYPSAWNAWYQPVTPNDALQGIDLVAKYMVKEGSINSSVFTHPMFEGHYQNQKYYAPFSGIMQAVYRFLGYPFGQVWLTVALVSFCLVFYRRLAEEAHPVVAGLGTLMLVTAPEFYAYTFLFQTDFINAVYFAMGAFWLLPWVRNGQTHAWLLASFFLGASVWCRAETVLFCGALTVGAWLFRGLRYRNWAWKPALGILAGPVFFLLLWNGLYFYFVLASRPDNQILLELTRPDRLFSIMGKMNKFVFNSQMWGYLVLFFVAMTLLSLLIFRRLTPLETILAILLFYLTFALTIYHFNAANVPYTFRRGFFKFLPLLLLAAAQTDLSRRFSQWLYRLEGRSA
jgi:hypothetical protein